MSLKSLMSYTFVSKYARWDSKKLRRETWAESVDRVRQMMVDKYVDDSKDSRAITKAIDQAYDDMKKKKILAHKEHYSLVDLQYLNITLEYIIVLLHTLIERDSFKNVCIYYYVDVVLDFLCKNIILPNCLT